MKKSSASISASMLFFAVSMATLSATVAADVIRHPLPNNSKFPIASAVEVPAGNTIVFQSGTIPGPANPDAERGTPAFFGDTKTQTISVFERIKVNLKRQGMDMGDIVKLTVFLVGDPANGGKMDFGGFMEAYTCILGPRSNPICPHAQHCRSLRLSSPSCLSKLRRLLFARKDDVGLRDSTARIVGNLI